MAGGDIFKAVTESLRETGGQILQETDTLKGETNSLLGKIDDTCKSLPPVIYNFLEPGFPAWKALLGRSNEERERMGKALQLTAQAIEDTEQGAKGSFTIKHK